MVPTSTVKVMWLRCEPIKWVWGQEVTLAHTHTCKDAWVQMHPKKYYKEKQIQGETNVTMLWNLSVWVYIYFSPRMQFSLLLTPKSHHHTLHKFVCVHVYTPVSSWTVHCKRKEPYSEQYYRVRTRLSFTHKQHGSSLTHLHTYTNTETTG